MIRQGFAVVGAAAVLAIGGVVTPLRPSAQAASMTMGSISLLAPATGSVITSNTIDVQIAVKGFTLSCPSAGKAPLDGVGHWHLLLEIR